MKYSYFVFDLDGTLLDTSEGIFDALEKTVEELNLPFIPRDKMKKYIGPQLSDSFNQYLGFTGETLENAITVFRNKYASGDSGKKASVYDGNFPLLNFIKSCKGISSVATFKYEPLAYEVLEYYKLKDYFSAIGGSPKTGGATKKDLITQALKKMGCTDLKKAVMLGDTFLDGEGAIAVGIDFIGCEYGFGDVAALKSCNPVLIAKHPLEIIEFIK